MVANQSWRLLLVLVTAFMIRDAAGARGEERRGHLKVLGLHLEPWQRPQACGYNCLFVFLQIHGYPVAHEELIAEAATAGKGLSLAALQDICGRHGLATETVLATPGVLDQVPLPAIAHFGDNGGNHFVVLHEVKRDQIAMVDGGTGRIIRMPRNRFESKWSGYLLIRRYPEWLQSTIEGGLVLLLAVGVGHILTRFCRRRL